MRKNPSFLKTPLEYLEMQKKEKGDFARFRLGPRRCILLSHPDMIREVLVKRASEFRKGDGQRGLSALAEKGLLLVEGKEHKRHRKLAQPFFHPRRLEEMYEERIIKLINENKPPLGEPVDVLEEMTSLTLRIISDLMFGKSVDGKISVFQESLAAAIDWLWAWLPLVSSPLFPIVKALPVPLNIRFWRGRKDLRGIVRDVVSERIESGQSRGDLLDAYIQAHSGEETFSRREIIDECITFFLAGHETTASALAWAWYVLAKNEDVQNRLREEGRNYRLEGTAIEERLPYTHAVFQECLRLFPTFWIYSRRAVQDMTIAGQEISAGTNLFVSPWIVQRDPRWWENPHEFRPERFLEKSKRPRLSFCAFGAGPRVCIGEGLAKLEGTLILSRLCADAKLSVQNSNIHPQPRLTLRPNEPIQGLRSETRRSPTGRAQEVPAVH